MLDSSLHHLASLRQVLGEIVCRAYSIAFGMCELTLDGLMMLCSRR